MAPSKTISANASPARKAAWEKATGLKAPAAPVAPKAATPTLSTRTQTTQVPLATGTKESPGKTTSSSAINTANTPIPAATDPLMAGKENAQTFLSIIGSMPVETRNRYLSSFTDFLALPPESQAAYLSGLEGQAKAIVEPLQKQKEQRLREDADYEIEKRDKQKRDLQTTFNKILGDMDFNKSRDIAKENETAARVMQNIGNTAFVTGVAGSGIFSRRTYYARENAANNIEDTNIDYSQKRGDLELKKSQAEGDLDAEISRLLQLNKRDVYDLDQEGKQDTLSLFFELAGNKFGQVGEQDRQILQGMSSAADDFAKGGTDADRKARDKAKADAAAALAERQRIAQAVGEYKNLYGISRGLELLGRNAELPSIQAAMNRLLPDVQGVLDKARSGQGDFYGSGGAGLPGSVGDYTAPSGAWDREFLERHGLLYKGINEQSRKSLSDFLQSNLDTIRKYQS